MGLINLQTNLKSLKFGNDRIGGGNSKQPYIQTPIPDQIGEFGFLNQDFILRGGSKAVTDSATDVVRLGKYFTDLNNPSGLLFIAKQNLLSRTAVRTQVSTGLLNEGVYTPLSDINKKKDFEDSTIGLNAILGLKPILYRMKSDDELASKELGFIAQEVKEFIPQAYVENGENDEKFIGLNYNSIVAALVKAIQELSKQNEELSNRLTKLESK